MAIENVFFIGVLDLAMGLHVIAPRKDLMTHWTLMLLWTMDIGVVPPIGDRFVATHAAIERRKGPGELHEQRRVVNVMITPR
jgi:hypothetical protein